MGFVCAFSGTNSVLIFDLLPFLGSTRRGRKRTDVNNSVILMEYTKTRQSEVYQSILSMKTVSRTSVSQDDSPN